MYKYVKSIIEIELKTEMARVISLGDIYMIFTQLLEEHIKNLAINADTCR